MLKLSDDELVRVLPELFKINLKSDKNGENIFAKLGNIFEFDFGQIYYINPDSVQLKYSNINLSLIDTIYKMSKKNIDLLFSEKGFLVNEKSQIIKSLEFVGGKSYIIQKLKVGSTVYGFVVLGSKKSDAFKEEDLNVLEVCNSILSYVIKDLELSNVFKIQLKALKDGLIEKNNAYKIIKEQNEKILEADKIKTEFLANVSHELRTPLNAILGFSEILHDEMHGKLNSKQKEYISDIRVAGLHLLGMINEILDMSKIEAHAMHLVPAEFPVRQILFETANILKPLADKKGVKIIIDCEDDVKIHADYQKLLQVLYNLVNNAIKYSPENDEVEVGFEYFTKPEKKFILKVHDNGIGIDKKYHGKIFAKFVQLDSAYTKKESSTGLGLTITKELVELHNGKISIISEVNNGSTFIVEIPQV